MAFSCFNKLNSKLHQILFASFSKYINVYSIPIPPRNDAGVEVDSVEAAFGLVVVWVVLLLGELVAKGVVALLAVTTSVG